MIKNIIFDFGDIFIDLDKPATAKAMEKFGFEHLTPELDTIFKEYEKGVISSPLFLEKVSGYFPKAGKNELIEAWNAILKDFPDTRLEFVEELAKEDSYRLFLLSNTNDIHIEYVKEDMGSEKFNRFKNSFETFHLSYEMGMRKPDVEIFEFVLKADNLIASETLFIDDSKENTDAASSIGINVWNLQVGQEDITQLKSRL
ncbi:HAD family phosphatase [Flagellimonas sp. S3867]|uniref:HAD family hydrolase n=1 Tax=Flagellimonas sp. S3867 TaxID=2768063 RepID=UPI0016870E3E|nr:HAD family phosphatase [Flagellimonas sp. S3867]